MSNVTIIAGLLLILLGPAGYFGSESRSVTAFIPAFFGLPILVCGLLARNAHLRKHVMHAAVLLGLIGCLGAAYMGIPKLVRILNGEEIEHRLAAIMQNLMALICAVFVALCINSFIQARRDRVRASEVQSP